MDLIDTLRSTGTIREFTDEPVADETVVEILDTARFQRPDRRGRSAGVGQGFAVGLDRVPVLLVVLVKRLLGAPQHWAVAAVVALGRPLHRPRRLRRRPVASFTTVDSVTGPALSGLPPERS